MAALLRLVLLPVLLPSGSALSYSFFDSMKQGTILHHLCPRSAGMSGVSSINIEDPACIFLNPSELADIGGLCLALHFGPSEWEADVNHVGEYNQHTTDLMMSTATFAVAMELGKGFGLGLGVAKVSDFGFNGVNATYFDPDSTECFDLIEYLNASGGLWEIVGGASWRATGYMTLGVSAGVRVGGADYDYWWDLADTPSTDSLSKWTWEVAEPCLHLGAMVDVGLQTTVGACLASGGERYPSWGSVGVVRSFHVLSGGVLGVEFQGVNYDGSGIEENVRVFAEFPYPDIPDLRGVFSMSYTEAMYHARNTLGLSLCLCYRGERVGLDGAVGFGSRSRMPGAFRSTGDTFTFHSLDESHVFYSFGVTYNP